LWDGSGVNPDVYYINIEYVDCKGNYGTKYLGFVHVYALKSANIETDFVDLIKINSDLLVYPNPASQVLKVLFNMEDNIKEHYYSITSIDGKTLIRHKTDSNYIEIDISGLSRGVYHLTIQSDKEERTKRFVKE